MYQGEINEWKDHDPCVTVPSTSKRDEVEFKAFRILKRTMKIDCQRVRSASWPKLSGPDGNGEIDIIANFEGCLILVQCKNYTDAKVNADDIRKFEGVISRYPNHTTIGIYVTFATDRYSRNAINRAEASEFNILLTNVSRMTQDIINYVIEKLDNY
ncbi:hypothetical protein C2G38_2250131 [Gigaspora rosea]|uniref:Restriction endonuclease type IV Mrr domain-containing protein n=1 Tax=Gigaspora rosea TaxID=44941 RepID=A0A397UQ99_9GLOM|nr:hypothetical protein C2G38_2250131 [Gigaspora rosea]